MIKVHGFLGSVSEELRRDAAAADLVVGGRRHLDALEVPATKRVVLGAIAPAIEAITKVAEGSSVVVVASGDPLFFGVVRRLRRAGLRVEVAPGISSLQAAFAAVALPWDDAALVSAHPEGIEQAIRLAKSHPKVGVLTAPGQGLAELAPALPNKIFVLAEKLGEVDQRVRILTGAEAAALQDVTSPSVVLILEYHPDDPRALGNHPVLQGDAHALGDDEPKPGENRNPDGSDKQPIVGQVINSERARVRADQIDVILGTETKRYDGPAVRGLVAAWTECDVIISHLAIGATTRLIAPLLADKKTDPAVLVIDEGGRFVVPLVGGHVGGANDVARQLGEGLSATAVVTTATDSLGIPALDQLGWAYSGDVAGVTASIIGGKPVQMIKDQPWPLPAWPKNVAADIEEPVAQIVVTDQLPSQSDLPTVTLHPQSLVVGMGCNRGTSVEHLRALLEQTLSDAGLALGSVAALTSVDVKAGELGLLALANQLGVPYLTYTAEELAAQNAPNQSDVVRAEVGTGSVSEASVLARGADLIVPKQKTTEATCAVGRLQAHGKLAVVGLGPGARDLLSPRAAAMIKNATKVVGYAPYVKQIRDLVSPHAEILATKMGTEEARTAAAIQAAREGHLVAFVCGGDPAIYAMASPTLEMGTEGIDVEIIPGITAELAISAILGAPLGHDHATISLSDLHTDWDLILKRVRAAAEGDFVVTFYNPRSRTRLHHLPDALAILAEHRPPTTPVALVSQAERRRQKVIMSTLADFDPENVDMNTLVVVGSSTTTYVPTGDGERRMVTPRDYHWMGEK